MSWDRSFSSERRRLVTKPWSPALFLIIGALWVGCIVYTVAGWVFP